MSRKIPSKIHLASKIYVERLTALRAELAKRDLSGFVIPISDEHMSEYVGDYAQRLCWLTGFGGSAGTAVVLADKAAIFVDGRYVLQVREQVDGNFYDYMQVPNSSVEDWLESHAVRSAKIGYDAWLHGVDWVKTTSARLAKVGAELTSLASNPIDAIWSDRSEHSKALVSVHSAVHAGRNANEKRAAIAEWLEAKALDSVVISALDSVAWVFNLRGSDVPHTPVALAYALIHADASADLFIAPEKLTSEVRLYLGNTVRLHDYGDLTTALSQMSAKRVAVDPNQSVAAIFAALEKAGATIERHRDPSLLPKAIKNPSEIAGTRAAHIRDGAAVSQFLHWLEGEAPKGSVDELIAAAKLRKYREDSKALLDLSFTTISAAGPNGAQCHYRVNENSNRKIENNSIFLIDSGGQYADGTTDITRTVIIGEPTLEMRRRFTLVLKGHIALATARFPVGTCGCQLDTLARQYLWADGLDYAHGTGHGVGSYLAVHEGPQRIAKPAGGQAGTEEPLAAGMIVSNEPGYYKEGEYGIRIENLVLVVPVTIAGAEEKILAFETLSFAPIDRRLIDTSLLSSNEINWLNAYHAQVIEKISPALSALENGGSDSSSGDKKWLLAACAPIKPANKPTQGTA